MSVCLALLSADSPGSDAGHWLPGKHLEPRGSRPLCPLGLQCNLGGRSLSMDGMRALSGQTHPCTRTPFSHLRGQNWVARAQDLGGPAAEGTWSHSSHHTISASLGLCWAPQTPGDRKDLF